MYISPVQYFFDSSGFGLSHPNQVYLNMWRNEASAVHYFKLKQITDIRKHLLADVQGRVVTWRSSKFETKDFGNVQLITDRLIHHIEKQPKIETCLIWSHDSWDRNHAPSHSGRIHVIHYCNTAGDQQCQCIYLEPSFHQEHIYRETRKHKTDQLVMTHNECILLIYRMYICNNMPMYVKINDWNATSHVFRKPQTVQNFDNFSCQIIQQLWMKFWNLYDSQRKVTIVVFKGLSGHIFETPFDAFKHVLIMHFMNDVIYNETETINIAHQFISTQAIFAISSPVLKYLMEKCDRTIHDMCTPIQNIMLLIQFSDMQEMYTWNTSVQMLYHTNSLMDVNNVYTDLQMSVKCFTDCVYALCDDDQNCLRTFMRVLYSVLNRNTERNNMIIYYDVDKKPYIDLVIQALASYMLTTVFVVDNEFDDENPDSFLCHFKRPSRLAVWDTNREGFYKKRDNRVFQQILQGRDFFISEEQGNDIHEVKRIPFVILLSDCELKTTDAICRYSYFVNTKTSMRHPNIKAYMGGAATSIYPLAVGLLFRMLFDTTEDDASVTTKKLFNDAMYQIDE